MKSLSKREKKLLYFFVIFALIALSIYYVIMPMLNRIEDLESELSYEQGVATEYRSVIATIPTVEAGISDAEESAKNVSSRFYGMMYLEEMDTLIQQMLEKRSLFCKELTMTEPVLSEVAPFGSAPAEKSDAAADGESESGGYAILYVSSLTVTGLGSREDIIALADDFSQLSSMRMLFFSMAPDEAIEGEQNFVMRLEMYIY